MDSDFLEPWSSVAIGAASFEAELRREVPEGHPLYSRPLTAIARRIDSEPQYAVVHLTWRGEPEPSGRWPETRLFETVEQWRNCCMVPDHEEFGN
jgi:hypothetical protein